MTSATIRDLLFMLAACDGQRRAHRRDHDSGSPHSHDLVSDLYSSAP